VFGKKRVAGYGLRWSSGRSTRISVAANLTDPVVMPKLLVLWAPKTDPRGATAIRPQ